MQIIDNVCTNETHFPNVVLTIGSFDGIHLGHQRLLQQLIAHARTCSGTATLMTLRPHPRQFFSPMHAPNILTSDTKKEALLADAGLDVLFVLPFDAAVAHLDRKQFLEEIVLMRCGAKHLIVGHDFNFGKDAAGDFEYLCKVAPDYDLQIEQVPALIHHGERVSSTLVREAILQGDLVNAESFLGRQYSILGCVSQGRGIGAKIGFPTANIDPHHNAMPAHGVYIAEALIGERRVPAAVNIGIAPTLQHDHPVLEAHLLDFDENIVGEPIEIIFHKRIRPEKKFESIDALMVAIDNDVNQVRQYFIDQ